MQVLCMFLVPVLVFFASCAAEEPCSGSACEEAPTPCSQSGCLPEQFCNPDTQRCETRAASCQPADAEPCEDGGCSLCPSDLFCDASTGYCVPGDPCQFINCPRHQVCNPQLRACASLACDDNNPCPPDSICTEGNVCGLGCLNNDDCFPGTQCVREFAQQVGQCVTPCEQDTQCPWGEICQETNDIGQCVPEPPCEEDGACREGEICVLTQCRRPICRDDEECDAQEYCDVQTGDCKPNTCVDDQFEPNNTAAESAPLLEGAYQNLSLCRTDREDWYELPLPDPSLETEISIIYTLERSDLDLEAYTVDGTLIASSGLSGIAERLVLPPQTQSPILLRINAVAGTDSTYLLQINSREPSCPPDSIEPNNTLTLATPHPTAAGYIDSILCPEDIDILQLIPDVEGGGLRISVTVDRLPPNPADLSVEWSLHGQEWTRLPATNTRVFEDLFHFIRGDITPYVRIQTTQPPTEDTPPQPIAWQLESTPTTPPCADPTPDNPTPEQAFLLPTASIPNTEDVQATLSNAVLCLSPDPEQHLETDWFQIDTRSLEGKDLIISLNVDEPSGPFSQTTLYTGPTPTPWRVSTHTGTTSTLQASVSRFDRPLWLAVAPTNRPIDLLKSWPRYNLNLTLKQTSRCVQDRSEQNNNNTLPNASNITTTSLNAVLCEDDIDALIFTRPQNPPTPPFLRIQSLSNLPLRYTLRTSPTAQPLISGSTLPDAQQPTNITSWDALPESIERVWIEVSRTDDDDTALPYRITNN